MTTLCRDCFSLLDEPPADGRCPRCRHRRLVAHPELTALSIAHLDCDAFYASVEKRDDPSLRDKPVIVGGGHRGVVSAACYVARLYGVRSAMPMFKALAACPDAVVIKPNMAKYREAGEEIRRRMRALTPLVEPLSIDEAFLDLTGTEKLHHGAPAVTLARLAAEIERELSLTVSIGLSCNKFLAKIASDLDKPRGFAVIGAAEAKDFLADRPVSLLWGVGKALNASLEREGIRRIRDLWPYEEAELIARHGAMGRRLYRMSRGLDDRRVDPDAPTKSISAETTFDSNLSDPEALLAELWPLCETVARRLRKAGLGGRTVTLKLKTGQFRNITRSRSLSSPTQLADILYREGKALLLAAADGTAFRLIGIGASELGPAAEADQPDLLEPDRARRAQVARAVESVRERLGSEAITRGRGLTRPGPGKAPR
ncbi:DNA polymerase-4 [Tistlia consotensis]|uniref:DNA polymerase IV n=1 Tax=Tistlia consotensis USBA 355 TaxID=560819 RepID=A0A1Y6BN80_9PROT|nr:DNA polymerase IV [Tistlia consotensis]SMF20820.1 DNA polymerase-4 [Tistlia consotensis USBA 355]SNR47508.1 DNA polymerase-4 [Tistlia consotensis]